MKLLKINTAAPTAGDWDCGLLRLGQDDAGARTGDAVGCDAVSAGLVLSRSIAISAGPRSKLNFDHPDSLESELIVEHVRALAKGQTIQRPVYDFKTHSRVAGVFETITPTSVVLVEGILALHYSELLPCYGFSIYVNAPQEVCLVRRIDRDMSERGRTEESVRAQFAATARPMAELYVVPSAARATITVEGTDALDWSVEQVLKRLKQDGLIWG